MRAGLREGRATLLLAPWPAEVGERNEDGLTIASTCQRATGCSEKKPITSVLTTAERMAAPKVLTEHLPKGSRPAIR